MSRRPWLGDQGWLYNTQSESPHRYGNVYRLIARREICPGRKKKWGRAPNKDRNSLFELKNEAIDARSGLYLWAEEESLRHLSAKYCPLEPSPKSTIAAAFSRDGRKLASTHGDHTVKIIDSQTGTCLKVLRGHERTPWVVRFHPEHNEILASGSLDHEVHVWNATTSEIIASRHFSRPIASIAFHAEGEFLAVASGHKLYLWQYKGTAESSSPMILLKTRRSLRAVNFHPHAPLLLTAEVNDLDSSDLSMSRATSFGCLHYSSSRLHMTNVHLMDHLRVSAELPLMPLPSPYLSSSVGDDISVGQVGIHYSIERNSSQDSQAKSSTSMHIQVDASPKEQNDPADMPPVTAATHSGMQDKFINSSEGEQTPNSGNTTDVVNPAAVQEIEGCIQSSISNPDVSEISNIFELPDPVISHQDFSRFSQHNPPSDSYPAWSELPVQQRVVSQDQTGVHPRFPPGSLLHNHSQDLSGGHHTQSTSISNRVVPMASLAIPPVVNSSLVQSAPGMQQQQQQEQLGNATLSPENEIPNSLQRVDFMPLIGVIQSELAASFSAACGADLPCTVKLRIWSHDAESSSELPDDGRCRLTKPLADEQCWLTIPHAVLCSEMGAHFSPCGRYLAACVACVLPEVEAELGFVSQLNRDVGGAGFSPTRHPTFAKKVLYELRIYSLEDSTFGKVLVSRAVRAAHCLTSIQFSPTSEHLLLAYGRRHGSLLKSIVINGEISLPVYTVLEVYRVSDLQLVSVLPSAEDEVNVACFHPCVGGGLIYGTKEGRLRILQYDGAYKVNYETSNIYPGAKIVEIQTHALEC